MQNKTYLLLQQKCEEEYIVSTIKICSRNSTQYKIVCDFAAAYYAQRLDIQITDFPDRFVYLEDQHEIIGCFGILFGKNHHKLPTEWYMDDLISSPLLDPKPNRRNISEIGTRVVHPVQAKSVCKNLNVSVLLTAALLLQAHTERMSHVVFTGDRSVSRITRTLGIELYLLGAADIRRRDPIYQEKWRNYFRIKRNCYSIPINTRTFLRCTEMLLRANTLIYEPTDDGLAA